MNNLAIRPHAPGPDDAARADGLLINVLPVEPISPCADHLISAADAPQTGRTLGKRS